MEMAARWFLHHERWPTVSMSLPLIFHVLHAGRAGVSAYGHARGAHGHQYDAVVFLLASGRGAKLLNHMRTLGILTGVLLASEGFHGVRIQYHPLCEDALSSGDLVHQLIVEMSCRKV
ncbi:unnamed protein product [Urochloa humidicola]